MLSENFQDDSIRDSASEKVSRPSFCGPKTRKLQCGSFCSFSLLSRLGPSRRSTAEDLTVPQSVVTSKGEVALGTGVGIARKVYV